MIPAVLRTPFPCEHELASEDLPRNLPPLSSTFNALCFMETELSTPTLDELHPRLWLVAKKAGNNVDALHRQKIKGRTIVIAEDPSLHLTWDARRIFVKPMLLCLLKHEFWDKYLALDTSIQSTIALAAKGLSNPDPTRMRLLALGFIRSYALLIKHRSDFLIAREHGLLPVEVEWQALWQFLDHFRNIDDSEVAPRFQYGQLRLSRLNWAVRIFQSKTASTRWFYLEPYWSMLPYLTSATVPLAFIFASFSLVLSAMQVLVATPEDQLRFSGRLEAREYKSVCWVVSLAVILMMCICWLLFIAIPLVVLMTQLVWSLRHKQPKS